MVEENKNTLYGVKEVLSTDEIQADNRKEVFLEEELPLFIIPCLPLQTDKGHKLI